MTSLLSYCFIQVSPHLSPSSCLCHPTLTLTSAGPCLCSALRLSSLSSTAFCRSLPWVTPSCGEWRVRARSSRVRSRSAVTASVVTNAGKTSLWILNLMMSRCNELNYSIMNYLYIDFILSFMVFN